MKKIKFVFEEIFKNGGSRRHSMTIDLSIQKNWEAACNYDQFSEIADDGLRLMGAHGKSHIVLAVYHYYT